MKEYWKTLTKEEKELFCQVTGYSKEYWSIHLIPRRKVPSLRRLPAIKEASDGVLTYDYLVRYFTNDPS